MNLKDTTRRWRVTRLSRFILKFDKILFKNFFYALGFGRCLNPFDTGVTDRDIRNGISNVFSSSKYHKN